MPPKTNVYNLIVKSSFESSEHMPKKEQGPYFECWLLSLISDPDNTWRRKPEKIMLQFLKFNMAVYLTTDKYQKRHESLKCNDLE